MKLKGKVEERTIQSNLLNEEMKLLVYLPPSYTPLLRYPILIAQDGDDYFKLGKITRSSEVLFEDMVVEEYIIIGVPYKSVQDRRKKYHPDGEDNQKYIRFLVNELVPYIESEYSTLELSSARALIGDSLGATVSLRMAMSYPRTFGKVALQSPYVDDSILEEAGSIKDPSSLTIYHVAGKKETEVETTNGEVQNFIEPNRKLNEVLSTKVYDYYYEEFNGDHKWTFWQPDIPKALKFIFPAES